MLSFNYLEKEEHYFFIDLIKSRMSLDQDSLYSKIFHTSDRQC